MALELGEERTPRLQADLVLAVSRAGTVEEIDKMNRRQVRVTKEQNAECQKLLKLMGIPVVVVRPLPPPLFVPLTTDLLPSSCLPGSE